MVVVEFHEHVDVAGGPGVSSRDGAENGGVRDTDPAQFLFVHSECGENVVERVRHDDEFIRRVMSTTC